MTSLNVIDSQEIASREFAIMSTSTKKNSEMTRVNADDLVDDYPGYTFMTWKEEPFTGIGFEATDDGHIISETTYANGIEDGPERSWYWNGQLESEGANKGNRPHGFFKEWHESGKLKAEGLIELGSLIWRKEWDEEGNLVYDFKIEDHPNRLKALKSSRSAFKNYDPSYTNLLGEIK
jgi:antitoxin component YwqK of YwqJK toxin-antitoxin module